MRVFKHQFNYVIKQIFVVPLAEFGAVSAPFNKILDEFLTSAVATIDKLLDGIILPFSIRIDGAFLDERWIIISRTIVRVFAVRNRFKIGDGDYRIDTLSSEFLTLNAWDPIVLVEIKIDFVNKNDSERVE